jgi:hypothetical protein|tara:strand:+ start:139 stop:345 length:207 start_codon:yes stop_codon:yes gene_type:complete
MKKDITIYLNISSTLKFLYRYKSIKGNTTSTLSFVANASPNKSDEIPIFFFCKKKIELNKSIIGNKSS